MELGKIAVRKLLTDNNKAPQEDVKLQYITDDKINNNSMKEIYFRWLSRLVVICAVLSLGLFFPVREQELQYKTWNVTS